MLWLLSTVNIIGLAGAAAGSANSTAATVLLRSEGVGIFIGRLFLVFLIL